MLFDEYVGQTFDCFPEVTSNGPAAQGVWVGGADLCIGAQGREGESYFEFLFLGDATTPALGWG